MKYAFHTHYLIQMQGETHSKGKKMYRRDLLKIGLAAPFVLTSSMAQSSGGGGGPDFTAQVSKWNLYYSDGDDDDDDSVVDNFYINYGTDTFGTRLSTFNLYADEKANGKPTAAGALNGARRIGVLNGSYTPEFTAGFYVRPKTLPNVGTARVLFQVNYQGKRYTLSGNIRFRPLNARRRRKLAPEQYLRSQPKFANLSQNKDTLIISPRKNRARYYLEF